MPIALTTRCLISSTTAVAIVHAVDLSDDIRELLLDVPRGDQLNDLGKHPKLHPSRHAHLEFIRELG